MIERTALYRLFDATDQLLYVGIAEDPKRRWQQHAGDKAWWSQVARRDVEWLATRGAAEALERAAIVDERPLHNSRLSLPDLTTAEVAGLFAEYKSVSERERELRQLVKAAAVQELKAGATVSQLAKLTGLTPEYFRRIAREEGVARLRPPTVGKLKGREEQA